MSRTPPNLLYLTIYNPTLRPNDPIPSDDEDAEEQAHILFYTSKERAVSRDRMLRQVGLAKALISFSEMFNPNDPCSSVHSQSRRMIMVSPEPDFWIHACVEVGKAPRDPQSNVKGQAKERDKPKTPDSGKEMDSSKPNYDYHEGSIHDVSLRQDVSRGYERFKLTHGSFTSILSTLGQQALELQLERFFTPWAWSWNLEEGREFSEHLGVPLHPSFQTLVTVLDKFSLGLPNHSSSIIISPPHVVPCSKYSSANHPVYLLQHLLSLVPRTPEPSYDTHSSDHTSDRTVKLKHPPQDDSKDPPKSYDTPQSTSLRLPSANGSMDVRKWGWPGYLSFGRGSNKRPTLEKKLMANPDELLDTNQPKVVEVDKHALEDAISENISLTSEAVERQDADHHPTQSNSVDLAVNEKVEPTPVVDDTKINHISLPVDPVSPASSISSSVLSLEPPPPETPRPEFSYTTVYLADPENPLVTRRRRVYYTLMKRWMLALVGFDEGVDNLDLGPGIGLHGITEDVVTLFDEIESALNDTALSTDSLPSATKILQPTDSHTIATFPFTLSSPGFTSKSSHLYNAQQLQANDPEISEVFSRGQNPQHWHIARRGLGVSDDGVVKDGEVYMEVFRKEASLSDVDNVLAGVVRRCGLGPAY